MCHDIHLSDFGMLANLDLQSASTFDFLKASIVLYKFSILIANVFKMINRSTYQKVFKFLSSRSKAADLTEKPISMKILHALSCILGWSI